MGILNGEYMDVIVRIEFSRWFTAEDYVLLTVKIDFSTPRESSLLRLRVACKG